MTTVGADGREYISAPFVGWMETERSKRARADYDEDTDVASTHFAAGIFFLFFFPPLGIFLIANSIRREFWRPDARRKQRLAKQMHARLEHETVAEAERILEHPGLSLYQRQVLREVEARRSTN